jgi:hypothetical protein
MAGLLRRQERGSVNAPNSPRAQAAVRPAGALPIVAFTAR